MPRPTQIPAPRSQDEIGTEHALGVQPTSHSELIEAVGTSGFQLLKDAGRDDHRCNDGDTCGTQTHRDRAEQRRHDQADRNPEERRHQRDRHEFRCRTSLENRGFGVHAIGDAFV